MKIEITNTCVAQLRGSNWKLLFRKSENGPWKTAGNYSTLTQLMTALVDRYPDQLIAFQGQNGLTVQQFLQRLDETVVSIYAGTAPRQT